MQLFRVLAQAVSVLNLSVCVYLKAIGYDSERWNQAGPPKGARVQDQHIIFTSDVADSP